MIVCDEVCVSVGWTSSLLSCDNIQSSLVENIFPDETSGRGFMTTEFLLEDLSQADKRSSEEASLTFAVFQVLTAQNNQYTQAAYFGVACPDSCSHILRWYILLPFSLHLK